MPEAGLHFENPAATMEREDDIITRYVVDRPVHTAAGFRKNVTGPPTKRDKPNILEQTKTYFTTCTGPKLLNILFGLLPILHWLPRYKLKKWLAGDILSGITVGIVHIPQSLAFSLLAGVPAIFGLYVTFWTVLIYTLTGTSRHLSVGTFAIPSLLTQAVVIRFVPESERPVMPTAQSNFTTIATGAMTTTNSAIDTLFQTELDDFYSRRIAVASALCLLMGIFQLVFGVLRFGMITTYMSEPLLQGFTTGAALYVVLSQMPAMLGIPPQPRTGIGAFYLSWGYIFTSLPNTHIATLIISIFCCIVLLVMREVNERYSDKLKVPIPTEVILVVVFILASYLADFKGMWGVAIVDNMPLGFPVPRIPDVSILGSIVGEAFGVAIVGFALNISVSKFYAIKFGYVIDANQELVAYGLTNLIPAFFQCFPNAAALARCQIQVNSGGKTQVVGIIVTVILLLTILVAGPLFEPLPRSVLGCIITIGLVGVLKQFALIWPTFKASKPDGVIWVFTFLAICSLGVDIGLFASLGFAMIVSVLRTQRPSYEVLGSVKDTDVYVDSKIYKTANLSKGIVVFKFNAMLYYVNKDYFKEKLFKATGVNPDAVINQRKKEASKLKKQQKNGDVIKNKNGEAKSVTVRMESAGEKLSTSVEEASPPPDNRLGGLKAVVIDCSTISMLDIVGVKTIKALQKSYKQIGVEWILSNVTADVHGALDRLSYYADADEADEFISVHDAVLYMEQKLGREPAEEQERSSVV
uniref:SLC26A2 anion exchanger n=1 Tax=Phallusia mammillata TaxID=59560 RepID=A0A6F9DRX0_9ASCI|nr:SLC26A2 anion exchanger [Phallusia mammillata]